MPNRGMISKLYALDLLQCSGLKWSVVAGQWEPADPGPAGPTSRLAWGTVTALGEQHKPSCQTETYGSLFYPAGQKKSSQFSVGIVMMVVIKKTIMMMIMKMMMMMVMVEGGPEESPSWPGLRVGSTLCLIYHCPEPRQPPLSLQGGWEIKCSQCLG